MNPYVFALLSDAAKYAAPWSAAVARQTIRRAQPHIMPDDWLRRRSYSYDPSRDEELAYMDWRGELTSSERKRIKDEGIRDQEALGLDPKKGYISDSSRERRLAKSREYGLTPREHRMSHAVSIGHELDEMDYTRRGRYGIGALDNFSHQNFGVVVREHNRMNALKRMGGHENLRRYYSKMRQSQGEAPLLARVTGGKFIYGESPRLSRHATRRVSDLAEKRLAREQATPALAKEQFDALPLSRTPVDPARAANQERMRRLIAENRQRQQG